MALKNSEYYLEKETGKFDGNLIEYLKDEKKVIKEVAEVDGYVIDVVALTGAKQKYGNGTDGKTDVYKLEEVTPSTGSLEKVASTGELKIAVAETSTNKKYNVVYCKTESDKEILGTIEDNAKNENLISFTIDGKSYTAKKGMTWEDWRTSSYYDDNLGLYEVETGNSSRPTRESDGYGLHYDIDVERWWDEIIENASYSWMLPK